MADDNARISIVCEDAGAAAALSVVAETLAKRRVLGEVVVGPNAAPYFFERGVSVLRAATPPAASFYERSPAIVTGSTIWGMRLEARAVLEARRRGCFVVTFLDFWGNYTERLSFPGHDDLHALPDVLAVIDETMRDDVVAAGVPERTVAVTGSPAFDELWSKPRLIAAPAGYVLFLSQPLEALYGVAGPGHPLGYTERSVVTSLARACAELGVPLRVRPHPREDAHSLGDFLAAQPGEASLVGGSLLDACLGARVVVGMTTMALVEVAVRGMPTLSVQLGARLPTILPTIAAGATPLVTRDDELVAALGRTVAERPSGLLDALGWRAGAADRLLSVIDSRKPSNDGP